MNAAELAAAELGAGADRGSSPLVPVGIMRERELQCSSRNSNVSRAALETTEEVRQVSILLALLFSASGLEVNDDARDQGRGGPVVDRHSRFGCRGLWQFRRKWWRPIRHIQEKGS